jgi:glycosyltransferase involved in cell wall biosynthesis
MKKILIDAREWSTSTGRYTERLVYYLQEVDQDKNYQYVLLMKPKDYDTWTPKSKQFTKLVCKYKEFTFAEQIGLLWQIIRLKPDLVHFPMVQQPILYRGKVVTTMQDLTTLRFDNPTKNKLAYKFKQRVYYWVNYIATRKSAAIITPTEFVKGDVARTFNTNSRNITVTYEGVDTNEAKPEPKKQFEGKQFIIYLGRPTPHKNLERLVQAFAVVKQTHTDLHLILAGKTDTNYKRLERITKQQGIPDVHFTGWITDGQARWLYQHCEAYVFASLSEGFGLPVLEAMSAGAPIVSSNATCSPEVYGDAAYYFDPLDVADMATKISRVTDRPKLRAELVEAGKGQVKKYSWRRMAEQTLEVYHRALGE